MIPAGRTRLLSVTARVFALSGIWLLTIAVPGCRPPTLDPQEYGELITELPRLPETKEPHPLPEIEESADPAKDSSRSPGK